MDTKYHSDAYWSNLKVGVATRNLAVREQPNSQSKKVGYHYKGETFFIESINPINGWYRITWMDEGDDTPKYGYVYAKFIKGVGSVSDQKEESCNVSTNTTSDNELSKIERTMVDDIQDVVHKTEEKLNDGDRKRISEAEERNKAKKKKSSFLSFFLKLFNLE